MNINYRANRHSIIVIACVLGCGAPDIGSIDSGSSDTRDASTRGVDAMLETDAGTNPVDSGVDASIVDSEIPHPPDSSMADAGDAAAMPTQAGRVILYNSTAPQPMGRPPQQVHVLYGL